MWQRRLMPALTSLFWRVRVQTTIFCSRTVSASRRLHTHTHTHIHATPHKGSSLENVTAQQTPKASPAGLYTRLAESSGYKVHSSSPGQRIRWRSLRSTNHITSQFEEARSSFSLPEAIDFVDPTLLHLWMKVLSLNTAFISEVGASAPFKLDDWDVVTKAFNDQNNRGWIA